MYNLPYHTWYADKLGFDKATTTIKLCGLDPKTATAQDMDDMDPRFICLQCSTNGRCVIG
ncbi:hypothetical protein DFS33DRAFT_1307780 [Desarmillaria ectypa]|nr:hypothetical protein DFS33DRAFT_1307780 [Desarmillaria ectypa]